MALPYPSNIRQLRDLLLRYARARFVGTKNEGEVENYKDMIVGGVIFGLVVLVAGPIYL